MSSRRIGPDFGRRSFLRQVSAGAFGLTLFSLEAASGKPLRGLFPIGQTPFTPSDKLDLDGLAAEVKFCNRGGVHGFVWPQIASGWTVLTEQERLDGAGAILAAGKGGKTALVIGVQSPDMASVTRYASHAQKNGADAIISLPPTGVTDPKALLEFYQQVGKMTELPLFMQTQGSMSVDLAVEAFKTIPTLRYIKDEAGDPLQRVTELRQRTNDQLKVFAGNGVRTMITEMELGFTGHCPYTGLADLYAAAFDLFHSGKTREAYDMFGRILAFNSIAPESGNSLLVARGVFKPDTATRNAPPAPDAGAGRSASGGRGGGGGGRGGGRRVSVEEIRQALEKYLKPYLRG